MSRSSLHKKIKALTGLTPNDYIKLIRLNKAAELLGKRYGLFTDRVDVSGSLPVILAGEDALDD